MAGPQRKSLPDIYTLLLAIALVAMIVCIIMLYLETAEYGQNKTSGVPTVVQVVPADIWDHTEAICSTSYLPNPTNYQTNGMHGCSIDFAFGKLT